MAQEVDLKVQEQLTLAIPLAARDAAEKMAKERAAQSSTMVRATMAMKGLDMASFATDTESGRRMREAFRMTVAGLLPNIDPARVQINLVRQ